MAAFLSYKIGSIFTDIYILFYITIICKSASYIAIKILPLTIFLMSAKWSVTVFLLFPQALPKLFTFLDLLYITLISISFKRKDIKIATPPYLCRDCGYIYIFSIENNRDETNIEAYR